MRTLKYNIGDQVRIVDKHIGNRFNPDGEMDEYLGTVMTIHSKNSISYRMEEDLGTWCWFPEMITGIVPAYISSEQRNKLNNILGV